MPFKKHNTRQQQSKSQQDSQPKVHQPTDIVLAKVKGYPPWPAMIIPNEIIPPNVLKTNSHVYVDENETENEEDEQHGDNYIIYSKILKFKKYSTPQEVYCVKFFKDDSYIWVKYDDLQTLTLKECQDWLTENESSGKHKRLIPAYEMACDGFKGNGIDVWEFVEYGSKNRKTNADDEEYTEVENSTDSPRSGRSTRKGRTKRGLSPERPTRISIRQRHLREEEKPEEEEEEVEEKPRATKKRNTRSTGKNVKELEIKKAVVTPPPKKKAKVESKPVPPKPIIEKYHYEDDEDWTIVGMGPQNYTVTAKTSSLVTKLSQKKNLEKHNETRLDLIDRILSVNKLLFNIFTGSSLKDEYEILLDELDIILAMNGSKNEFISTIRNNNELLVNFRILFNLKLDDLQKFDLYDNFQQVFDSIYDCSFIPDLVPWSKNKITVDESAIDDTSSLQNESATIIAKVEDKQITSETK
ncbi:ISWI one complex protein 4 [Monosporozyma servazzii]